MAGSKLRSQNLWSIWQKGSRMVPGAAAKGQNWLLSHPWGNWACLLDAGREIKAAIENITRAWASPSHTNWLSAFGSLFRGLPEWG